MDSVGTEAQGRRHGRGGVWVGSQKGHRHLKATGPCFLGPRVWLCALPLSAWPLSPGCFKGPLFLPTYPHLLSPQGTEGHVLLSP